MSASSKKKLRKELNAAAMTEKQLQEQKDTKKLRLYTAIFGIAIAAMILVVIVSRVFSGGMIPRSTTALTVGDSKISAAELNHYYIDSVNSFLNQAGDYVSLFGLDTTKALDEQFYNEAEEQTWADYFLDQATVSAQNMYAIYNEAKAQGCKLSEESKAAIDSSVENLKLYATLYGFGSTDAYIAAMYGEGCNEDTFRAYAEVQMIAQEYATAKNESLTYDDAAIRAEYDANPAAYSAFTYNYCYLTPSKFYEGGTKDDSGNVTYSDAEKEAGRAAAEAAANTLAAATTIEELDAAYAALAFNAEVENAKSNRQEKVQYANVTSVIRDWVTAADRKAGDITVIPSESTTHNHAEGEECTGDDGTTDDSGNTTYSDEEKATARKAAMEILDTFNAGEKTEEAFAALATEKTTDPGSKENGGLYEDVYPGQMVTAFNDWCFDAARVVGETGIVETEYGCHVMYFSGNSGKTYRDFMIESTLRNADLSAWEAALIEGAELNVLNTKYIRSDLVLSSGN